MISVTSFPIVLFPSYQGYYRFSLTSYSEVDGVLKHDCVRFYVEVVDV